MNELADWHFAHQYASKRERNNQWHRVQRRKTALERLTDTLAAMPAPPCTRYGNCPHLKHCAATGDACDAFMLYAAQVDSDNAARIPKRKLGKRLWNRKEIFSQSIESLLTNAK